MFFSRLFLWQLLNEWMKWTLKYRLISDWSTKCLYSSQPIKIHIGWAAYLGRVDAGPNAKINCLFSHRHIFGHFLVFQSFFKLHFSLPTFILRHLRFTCWVSVCYWHCLNTYYFRTNFVGVPGSFNSDHVKCICYFVARIDIGLKSHPNDWAIRYKSLA